MHSDTKDLAIVGGGPAGAAAAIYAQAHGLTTTWFTGGNLGGQVFSIPKVLDLPGYPRGIKGKTLGQQWIRQYHLLGGQSDSRRINQVHYSDLNGTAKLVDRRFGLVPEGAAQDMGFYRTVIWAVGPEYLDFLPAQHLTTTSGLFLGGECASTAYGIARAMGDGQRVAQRAMKYLEECRER